MLEYQIQGAKGGGKKPHTPVETPNNLLSVAYAKVLIAVAEGELAGRPTEQDIFLDGTPLANADGSLNFGGVKWEWRPGSQDQEHIQGLPEVSTEYGINVELRDATPWVRQITKTQLDAVRVTFQWPSLMKAEDNGDVNGYSMDYAIDISTDGGAFVEYQKYNVNGKTNTSYERTHRVDLPKAARSWTIRARRITPEDHTSKIQDTINVKTYAEVVDAKQRYPNTALLYVEFDSRLFGGSAIPKVSVRTKGRVIQVPANYDPELRTYSGVWAGDFKWAWSDNPAWVFYDLVTQNRFGMGHKVTPNMIDKWALYEVAQYCDVMVDDGTGAGTKEPRHTCNIYIQQKAGAWKLLRDIASIFNGMTYWDGNKFVAVADKQESLANIPVFSRSNVVNGRFDYQAADDKSIYTSALVSYDDPNNHYNTEVEATFETSQILRWGGDRQTEISAIGCTSRGEAQRKGKYTLITNMFNRQVSFRTGLQGLNDKILPGKLIHVADPLIGGKPFTGRVVQVVNQRQCYLDRETDAKAGDILYMTRKDGVVEGRTVSRRTGVAVTVGTAYTETPVANTIWYLESAELKSQVFRVTKISSPEESVYEIEAVEYNESKYSAIDNGARLEPRPISVTPPNVQQAPKNITLRTNTYVEQTMAITTMTIGWDQTPNAVNYEVQWKVGDGDWVIAGYTGAPELDVKGIYTGRYVARVRAVNAFGIKSVWTTSMSTQLDGKAGTPPKLASFTCTPMLFGIRQDWTFPEGAEDTLRTEIMYSETTNFAQAKKLGDYSYPTDSNEMHGLKAGQQFWFWTRLVDRTGNIGDWYPATTEVGIHGRSSMNDNGEYNDYFAEMISDTALDKALYDRIELIDGDGPGSVNERIDKSIESITVEVGGISDRLDTVNKRVDAANLEIENTKKLVNANKVDADNKIKAANDAIIANKADADKKIKDTNTKVDNINKALNDRVDSTNVALDTAVKDLQDQINNFEDAFVYDPTKTYKKGDIVRQGNRLYQALGDVGVNTPPPNTAKWKDVGTIIEDANNLAMQVESNTTNIGIIDGKVTSTSQKIEALTSAWRDDDGEGALEDALRGWDSEARLGEEKLTRANEDEALAQRITSMTVRFDENEAKINTLEQTIANETSALAQRVTEIQASTIVSNAHMSNLEKVVADNNSATAERLNSMTTQMANSDARIIDLSKVVVENNIAMSQRVETLSSRVDNNSAQITQILETVVTDNSALVERVNKIDAQVGENASRLTELTKVVADNNTAITERVDQMSATVGKNTTDITNLTKTVADEKTATATRFQSMQAEVDGNKAAISDLATSTAAADKAINERITQMDVKVGNNTANITALTKTVADNNTAMTQRVDSLTSTVGQNTANIKTLTETVATNDSATNKRIDSLTTTVGKNTSDITTLTQTVTDLDSSTATRFQNMQSKVDKNTSDISTLETTVTTKDTATNKRIDSLKTTVDGHTSQITTINETITNLEGTTATSIQLVNSRVDKEIKDRDDAVKAEKSAREASVASEATTRANADSALGRRIDTTDANVATNAGKIQQVEEAQAGLDSAMAKLTLNMSAVATALRDDDGEGELEAALNDWNSEARIASETKVLADENEATASRVTDMTVKFETDIAQTNASLREEQLARADADSAIVQNVTRMEAVMQLEDKKLSAAITEEQVARVTATEALAQDITRLRTDVNGNTAAISQEAQARSTADEALALRITSVEASMITPGQVDTKIDAKVRTEELARVSADEALGERITKVQADMVDETKRVNALIQSEETARVTADTALGSRIDSVSASMITEAQVNALIKVEENARVAADNALGQRITSVEATIVTEAQINAKIKVEETARVNADTALGKRIDTVQASMITDTQVKALIQVETNARVTADEALGERITNVQATADGNTSAIKTVSQAQAKTDGKVNASWQVKMEVNSQGQYVAAGIGLGIENGPAGLQSQFLVRADRFAVVNGTNKTTTAPFVVQGGQVFMNEALISKAMIGNAIIGSTLQSAQQTNWGGPVMTMDFNIGNVICRHPTMANTYTVMNQNGIDVVVSGVRRVRMGVW